MAHHVIYIPGLGDDRSYGQDIILRLWRIRGLTLHYFPLGWADKENFAPKLTRLIKKVDELSSAGHKVSLIGVSAGASAVLAAFSERKDINKVVCIVGKINNPQNIGEVIYKKNPAFKQSMASVSASLASLSEADRKKIMSIHPLHDKTVPKADTIISGAIEKTIPVRGHIFSIFYMLIFGSRLVATFLKKPTKV